MATKSTAVEKAPAPTGSPEAQTRVPSVSLPPGATVLGPNDYRSDDLAVVGHFATATKGEEKGLFGVVEYAVTFEPNGEPKAVVVRERHSMRRVVVAYSDLEYARADRR